MPRKKKANLPELWHCTFITTRCSFQILSQNLSQWSTIKMYTSAKNGFRLHFSVPFYADPFVTRPSSHHNPSLVFFLSFWLRTVLVFPVTVVLYILISIHPCFWYRIRGSKVSLSGVFSATIESLYLFRNDRYVISWKVATHMYLEVRQFLPSKRPFCLYALKELLENQRTSFSSQPDRCFNHSADDTSIDISRIE